MLFSTICSLKNFDQVFKSRVQSSAILPSGSVELQKLLNTKLSDELFFSQIRLCVLFFWAAQDIFGSNILQVMIVLAFAKTVESLTVATF
jgi:hypothetical protein